MFFGCLPMGGTCQKLHIWICRGSEHAEQIAPAHFLWLALPKNHRYQAIAYFVLTVHRKCVALGMCAYTCMSDNA